ncbi:uncharacterized protein K452DRAFT_44426 [Aplosporella prunicola CBS 121167]|uniref:Uncharacterized protein n=1 Tax=Aplosporella prunicola CBS 121167 TaxID=1176127 RepID=A0A6A6BEY9_9PEZI|nr:uncharacterized protein K452DRAFT_44426 [Aplosporella prunicola CBS 121167]KAF2141051.1 hypothetical protein K452DRAFT_44426 [Aplosporella prunicola CBS 121167]
MHACVCARTRNPVVGGLLCGRFPCCWGLALSRVCRGALPDCFQGARSARWAGGVALPRSFGRVCWVFCRDRRVGLLAEAGVSLWLDRLLWEGGNNETSLAERLCGLVGLFRPSMILHSLHNRAVFYGLLISGHFASLIFRPPQSLFSTSLKFRRLSKHLTDVIAHSAAVFLYGMDCYRSRSKVN